MDRISKENWQYTASNFDYFEKVWTIYIYNVYVPNESWSKWSFKADVGYQLISGFFWPNKMRCEDHGGYWKMRKSYTASADNVVRGCWKVLGPIGKGMTKNLCYFSERVKEIWEIRFHAWVMNRIACTFHGFLVRPRTFKHPLPSHSVYLQKYFALKRIIRNIILIDWF